MLHDTHYAPRAIRFLELLACPDWRLKVYTIAYAVPPDAALVGTARALAQSVLPPVVAGEPPGVGFLTIHAGRDAHVVLVSWWSNSNELRQCSWRAPLHRPDRFEQVTSAGFIGCVWDLALIAFEREAWVRTVLAASEPDLDAYLAMRLSSDI
jgi:hypothetical protein